MKDLQAAAQINPQALTPIQFIEKYYDQMPVLRAKLGDHVLSRRNQ